MFCIRTNSLHAYFHGEKCLEACGNYFIPVYGSCLFWSKNALRCKNVTIKAEESIYVLSILYLRSKKLHVCHSGSTALYSFLDIFPKLF